MNTSLLSDSLSYHFNLGAVASIIPYASGVFKVTADTGFFFLRIHKIEDVLRLETVERAEQFLKVKNVPVVLPLQTSRDLYHLNLENVSCSLYPFVEGVQFVVGNVCKNAAEMLARIHLCPHNECEYVLQESASYNLKNPSQALLHIAQLIHLVESKREKSDVDTTVLELLNLKKVLVSRNLALYFDAGTWFNDRCIVHGSYGLDKLFFDEQGGIKAVCGFGESGLSSRHCEVVQAAMELNDFDQAASFVEFYNEVYALDKVLLAKAFEVYTLGKFACTQDEELYYMYGEKSKGDVFAVQLDAIRHLEDSKKELMEQLCDQAG